MHKNSTNKNYIPPTLVMFYIKKEHNIKLLKIHFPLCICTYYSLENFMTKNSSSKTANKFPPILTYKYSATCSIS